MNARLSKLSLVLAAFYVAAGPILAKLVELTNQESDELALYAPDPTYPKEAREKGQSGAGIAMLTIDTPTGHVIKAEMRVSTRSKILDQLRSRGSDNGDSGRALSARSGFPSNSFCQGILTASSSIQSG